MFILDEIVTGFRLSLGGAIDYYRLSPRVLLGKIVGGGMPIGVLCGEGRLMSQADPVLRETPNDRVVLSVAGLFQQIR